MNFYWKQCGIQRNVVITIIAVWLACTAHCQTNTTNKTTTTKWYTLLEDNPVYVQNFVSRMMSKYPIEKEKPIRDVTGVEIGPNLGYEPYWKNLPDMAWERKCSRCPELFEKYKTVCAIDSMGEVMVNISMCNVIQQNCLAGLAFGNSTGFRNDFKNQYFVVANGWARISIRQRSNAVIQLSSTADNSTGDRYTIEIDWDRWWSGIFRNDRLLQWHNTKNVRSLWPDRYVEFVMRWNTTSGWLLVTRSALANWTEGFHINITDPDPFPIKYIAVGGSWGQKGDWIIKDLPSGFMVTQLEPCADGEVAQPLVTSPTEPAVVYKQHHPINVAYFTRIHREKLEDNMTFHTREEY